MSGVGTTAKGKVYPLHGNQRSAVDPADSVWLSASAGTGKTQVLSARVLRLLLTPGVRPEQILCLTFTKAGAAEMATRVHQVLADWVRKDEAALGKELIDIGADNSPATIAQARTLFAAVLDCPGGGLRIETIHAFAQWLLAAFPTEAGLLPGTRPMEDRDRDLLAAQVLRGLLVDWEAGDPAAVAALEMLSLRLGPDKAREWLMRCARAREAWFGPGAWQPPMRERVKHLLGLPADLAREDVAGLCGDETFTVDALRAAIAVCRAWGTKTGNEMADQVEPWLNLPADQRLARLSLFEGSLFKKDNKFSTRDRGTKEESRLAKVDPAYPDLVAQVSDSLTAVIELQALFELVDFVTPALELGRKFALAWDEAKTREGLVDFDDLIRRAADLLGRSDLSDWIRYKLDRQFDHILVDEAQDTNEAQWAIIDALTDDFFSGQGQREDRLRTVFVVGDFKQAIFGFQGTSPENFNRAFQRYRQLLRDRYENLRGLRQTITVRELQDLDLGRSYRTARAILEFVDAAIDAIGPEQIGLDHRPEMHVGEERPGLVTLWQPVAGKPGEPADEEEEVDGAVSSAERRMADGIARQVKHWLDHGFALSKGERRNARAGDIMVLVRKRGELAGLIVARLHAAGVKVAGVDRLRLGAPLAVKDLLAALRFAVQPGDDLALACLLVSPLVGWSQDDLLAHGWRPDKVSLWRQLRNSSHPHVVETVGMLRDLLARADFEPPQALLRWLLLGPWQGRSRLVARLGREANDPIDELLNAATQFSASHTPSLTGFIHWFDAGKGELKREAEGAGDQLRVMTVHGAKGLQAPIVILADACGDPDASRDPEIMLGEELPGSAGLPIPLPPLSRAEQVGPIGTATEQARRQLREEHWRLLYVAMTRAEEALFIGGALKARASEPKPDSWYARLAPLFPAEGLTDPVWGSRHELGERAAPVATRTQAELEIPPPLPGWALRPVGEEPRPPRPLAPSVNAEEVREADPPLPPEIAAVAARRGVLIHALLERLPDVPQDLRTSGGRAWLARHGADLPESERADMLARAIAVLDAPDWRELFGPGALAEAPLAAVVGNQVITGTVDRLLVTQERVLVADFKTARRPPSRLEDVPPATLRQLAAYVAALEAIYPGRTIEAAVLYTQTPRLFAVPGDLLALHKPDLPQPDLPKSDFHSPQ